jgi:agmatinase
LASALRPTEGQKRQPRVAHPQERSQGARPVEVTLLGLPTDENSTYMRGAAEAPPRIREALHAGSSNLYAENGLRVRPASRDLGAEPRFTDQGDVALGSGAEARRQIEETVAALLAGGARVLALGGDHAITYPIIRAYARAHLDLTILHLDAHPDLYDEFEGNRYAHACPFARIMEEGLVARLVQVGIRGTNPHQREQAARFGVEVHEMRDWQPGFQVALRKSPLGEVEGPVYISLDMDALDPAFAPGVSHHEPGGLSTREVIGLIQTVPGPVVGADIVEFNPRRDLAGITAMAAAKLVKELAARMLAAEPRTR